MARKEFTFRGKKLEDLMELSMKELSKLMTSSVRRRINRGFTEKQQTLLKRIRGGDKNIKTHCRTMPVLPEMVDKTILVHNGKEFVSILIQPEMIGHILGEFANTRKRVGHSAPGVGATRSSSNVSVK